MTTTPSLNQRLVFYDDFAAFAADSGDKSQVNYVYTRNQIGAKNHWFLAYFSAEGEKS
ncbi:MAG: hypothetical protein R3E31_12595 [Chloroflexota bacterium]